MKTINWKLDQKTINAAQTYPLTKMDGSEEPQFDGKNFNPQRWNHRVIDPTAWPIGNLKSSPQQIMQAFQDGLHLHALAMIVSWGGMSRVSRYIYRDHNLATINEALLKCGDMIKRTQSIEEAWDVLTNQLVWSAVITSKTLHFLCRSLGFEKNPPVAIDHKVILGHVWPEFKKSVPVPDRPKGWRGNRFEAYSRYMTAMIVWANKHDLTTTKTETTVFARYY